MGALFGRNKKAKLVDPYGFPYEDPYGGPMPPTGFGMRPPKPYPYQPGYNPADIYGGYDPYEQYGYGGYGSEMTEGFQTYYGEPGRRGPNPYGGRYARGLNQMSGMSPWNYGNYYMGNTTMQMMPFMMKKVAKYAQRQAMGGGGGVGGGFMPMMPMMPMMPVMPCMPIAAPMMAAATPLPIAFNPLVQGMYPMASMSAANWMSPSSFMSALSTGPMPYRPPASLEFPSNIGMVMTVPYGTPNPLLSTPSFGGFSPQYNFGGGLSCCCCYCTPQIAPPAISYYPRPVSVPQPYPVPIPTPMPIANIQQVPVPRPVTVVAPPIVAGGNQSFSAPFGAPLIPSQGVFSQGGVGQPMVMGSHRNSTTSTLLSDQSSESLKRSTPVHNSIDRSRRAKAQRIAASLSNLGLDNNWRTETTPSKAKKRIKSNHIHDDVSGHFRRRLSTSPRVSRSINDLTIAASPSDSSISNPDWLTKSSTANKTKQKRAVSNEISIRQSSNSHHHRSSSLSQYDRLAGRQKSQPSRSCKNLNASTSCKPKHRRPKKQPRATNETIDEE